MRASSCSARAGMIASRSGSVPSTGVSLTASRYESVAAITILPGSKRTRMPVSTGRLSSRDALRPTRATVSISASRSTVCSDDGVDVGQPREVLGRVRVQAVVRAPDATTTTASSGRCSIVTSLSGSERAMSSSSRPGTTTVPSPSTAHSSSVRSETSMSVAARCSRPSSRAQLDAAEHEHRGTRRDATRDDRQAARELVLRDGNPQPGAHYDF